MTTCAIVGCRDEGALLLHIRHQKENLLQAEYCANHFSDQMKQWKDDIDLANNVKNFYYYNGGYSYGYEKRDIRGGLRFLWWLKDKAGITNGSSNDEVMEVFREHQQNATGKIIEYATISHDAAAFCKKHGLPLEKE